MAKHAKKSRGPHASWKGMLRLNLVNIPVQAFNIVGADEGEIHFHQLHEECHSRIQYKKFCPKHGEVPNDEIVSGYEYSKGKYVELEPEELDKFRTKAERSLKIDSFIEPGLLDIKYLDGRSYYLGPDGAFAHEAYSVLCAAMEDLGRWAIGEIVFLGKEQLVVVRADDNALTMSMLHHEAEVRSPVELGIHKSRVAGKQLQLAKAVIDSATTEKFDLGDYHDRYQEQLKRFIKTKVSGKDVVAPEEEDEEPEVINLMEALKKSLHTSKAGSAARRARSTKQTVSAPKKKRSKKKAG